MLQSSQGDRLSDLISRRHFYIEMLPLEFDSDSQVAKDKPMTSPHTSYSININELDEILGARPNLGCRRLPHDFYQSPKMFRAFGRRGRIGGGLLP